MEPWPPASACWPLLLPAMLTRSTVTPGTFFRMPHGSRAFGIFCSSSEIIVVEVPRFFTSTSGDLPGDLDGLLDPRDLQREGQVQVLGRGHPDRAGHLAEAGRWPPSACTCRCSGRGSGTHRCRLVMAVSRAQVARQGHGRARGARHPARPSRCRRCCRSRSVQTLVPRPAAGPAPGTGTVASCSQPPFGVSGRWIAPVSTPPTAIAGPAAERHTSTRPASGKARIAQRLHSRRRDGASCGLDSHRVSIRKTGAPYRRLE